MLKRPAENMFTRSKNVIVEIQADVYFDLPNLKQIQRKLQNVMPLCIKQKQIRTSRLQTQNNMHVSQVSLHHSSQEPHIIGYHLIDVSCFWSDTWKVLNFNQVQVMGFQILQNYVIDVSCFQICSILSLNVILCWEAHFLGWLPDFYIALYAFNVFYIFQPCLIFWKCCFSLCWKQWLIILKNK